jgi:TonB family protein
MRLARIVFSLAILATSASADAEEVSGEASPAPEASAAQAAAVAEDDVASADETAPAVPAPIPPDATLGFVVAATSQLDAREYAAAATLLTDGIAQIEHTGSRYDPRLAAPLVLLGDAYMGSRDYAKAQEAYEASIHVERVNDGLYTPKQVAAVYKQTEAMVAQGDFEGASARHEYAFDTLERAYGPTSVELVPGLYRLADWYIVNYNIYGARPLLARATDNLVRAHGERSPELIEPLRRLAQTYHLERCPPYVSSGRSSEETFRITGDPLPGAGVPTGPAIAVNRFSDGERALQTVIAIVEADPEATKVDLAVAVIDLADWNLFFDKIERAATLYRHADSLLRTDAGLDDAGVAQYLGEPHAICLRLPDGPRPPPADLRLPETEGHVELAYTIDRRGQVGDLTTVSSVPEGMMDLSVRKAFREAVYRPAVQRGELVDAPRRTYRYTFAYYPRRESTTGADPGALPEKPSKSDS